MLTLKSRDVSTSHDREISLNDFNTFLSQILNDELLFSNEGESKLKDLME